MNIPYSQKYWWGLNLAIEPKIAIARILVDLNLAYICKREILAVVI